MTDPITPQGQNGEPGKDAPYVEFARVSKSFGDHHVLDDVSFDVRRGETVVVLGRSGVGKSVTLKHIMGFLMPDEGEVRVNGQNVSAMSEADLTEMRRRVTMVFQSGALFDSLTVAENVAFPLRERSLRRGAGVSEQAIEERVRQFLGLVDLEENVEELMPSGLSTGMKRAVAIARALAAAPEAILYDEPTTMVDPLMAHTVGDLILKLKRRRGLTSIVVTHDMRLARKLADRVVFLAEGRAAFFGPMSAMDSCPDPLIREFVELDEINAP